MGSPLGPVFANIFLGHLEETYFVNCPSFPKFYRRYVDDIFAIVDHEGQAKQFCNFLNSTHPNMSFTMETEQDGKLNFLDTVVNKNDTVFFTSLYRKPTFTGLYTNWSSLIPLNYKIGLIKSLINRAYNISSSWELIHNELSKIKSCLISNDYPSGIIDSCINSFLTKKYEGVDNKPSYDVPKCKVFLKLPYLGSSSDRMKKQIVSLVQKFSHTVDACVVFKSSMTIANMFPYKDRIPLAMKSSVVYRINCEACSAFYVGKTTQCLSQRTERGKSGSEYHAFKEHTLAMGPNHTYQIDDVKIISSANNKYPYQLLQKESLLLKHLKPPLCKDKKVYPYIFSKSNQFLCPITSLRLIVSKLFNIIFSVVDGYLISL